MAPDILGLRTLNRTMLQRQWLDRRRPVDVVAAVRHLVGVNAQAPELPAPALAARLEGFREEPFWDALRGGVLVRAVVMRGTQHVVTAEDFALLRSAFAGHLARIGHNAFRGRLAGAEPAAIAARAEELLGGGASWTRPAIGRELAPSWPDATPNALGWMVQYLVAVVHPTDGPWAAGSPTPLALPPVGGRPPGPEVLPAVVERYLAAFGPALAGDVTAWCGLAGMNAVLAGMGDRLRTYRDERGRVLYDLAELEPAHPDSPAPVRFLPAFDAPVLAYRDRTRIMSDAVRARVCRGDAVEPTVLVDGFVAATWSHVPDWVEVRALRGLTAAETRSVEAEAEAALGSAVRVLQVVGEFVGEVEGQ